MKLKLFDRITLNGNEKYIVFGKKNISNKVIYFLINESNYKEKFGYVDNTTFKEITDIDMINDLSKIFINEIKK